MSGFVKKLILGFLLLILILATAVLGISFKAVDTLTTVKRLPITTTPTEIGLNFENVEFKSREDNLTLKGWFIPVANSDKVVILIHGKEKNRADTDVGFLQIAKGLNGAGFNVLTFDLRAHGESEGKRYSLGFYERRDVAGAVTYLQNRGFNFGKIGLLGFSLGAEVAISTTEELPQIGAVISDSSFANFFDTLKELFPKDSKLPKFFVYPVILVARVWLGIEFGQLNPEKVVARMPERRFLLIHGEADDTFPKENAIRLKNASKNPKTELWIVPGAGHTHSFKTQPEEYLKKVTEFFQDELVSKNSQSSKFPVK